MSVAATAPFRTVLAWRGGLLDDLAESEGLAGHAGALMVVMVLGAAGYGAVLGHWHGAKLAVYCAI